MRKNVVIYYLIKKLCTLLNNTLIGWIIILIQNYEVDFNRCISCDISMESVGNYLVSVII